MKKSILLKNTLIVLITGFVVKLIGMVGKIVTTRILGIEGMSLYVLSYPTLLLFINISGFSLNNSISKLTAESVASKKYSPLKILKSGIKISLIISLICVIVYGASIYGISNYLLKNENLFYPLLSGIILIPLVGLSDALRGYFNGIKEMNHASTSLFLEQLFRTTCSIFGVYFGIKYSIIVANCGLMIALALGELASISYCLIILKKKKIINYEDTKDETKVIFKMSFSLTLSRLIGSFTFFLEPILYTWALMKCGYEPTLIHNVYTEIDAFTIPLLAFIGFIPFSLSTAIIPHISEHYALRNTTKVNNYLHTAFKCTFYPASLCLIFIFFYHNELMMALYKTTSGAIYARNFCFFFLSYYFQAIISSILQAIGKVKPLFINSLIQNILRLLLIIILSYVKMIGPDSIIYATIICLNLSTIILFTIMKKATAFKVNKHDLLIMILVSTFAYFTIVLLNLFNVYYLITMSFVLLVYILITIKIRFKKI